MTYYVLALVDADGDMWELKEAWYRDPVNAHAEAARRNAEADDDPVGFGDFRWAVFELVKARP